MFGFRVVLGAAAVSAVVGVAIASASGGPPPGPASPPQLQTVVGHGSVTVDVAEPQNRRSNGSIEAVVAAARKAALAPAVNAARADAIRLARAAGLTLDKPIGVERDVAAPGYGGDASEGAYGPGQWCNTWRNRRRCHVPREVTVRVTLTVAAS